MRRNAKISRQKCGAFLFALKRQLGIADHVKLLHSPCRLNGYIVIIAIKFNRHTAVALKASRWLFCQIDAQIFLDASEHLFYKRRDIVCPIGKWRFSLKLPS